MGGVAWTKEEDHLLKTCIEQYGEGKWHRIPVLAGLNRCRKSCRLRWLNYLRPNIKRGSFAEDEIDQIIKLQRLLGNRWSIIAGKLPGRTANDVKNYWKCHLSKKLNAQDQAEKKATTQNVKVFKPQTQNLATSSTRPRSPKNLCPPPSPPPSESLMSSTLVPLVKQAEDREAGHDEVLPTQDKENYILEIEEHDLVGDLSMDSRFEEIKVTCYDHDSNGTCSNWDSDDPILSLDLWSEWF